jgi:hypothetical protein
MIITEVYKNQSLNIPLPELVTSSNHYNLQDIFLNDEHYAVLSLCRMKPGHI